MSRLRRLQEDRGESLIELILAIGILGICVLAIGSSIALSVKTSAIHRKQATADAFLHNYAETLQSSYALCNAGAPPNYVSGLATPGGFNSPSAAVAFWNPGTATFGAACPATDAGLQQVKLTLASANGLVSESLVVVLRKTT
jgi:type II secretory pathway pseudopilin PulG